MSLNALRLETSPENLEKDDKTPSACIQKIEPFNHRLYTALAACSSGVVGISSQVAHAATPVLHAIAKTQDLTADAGDAVSDTLEEIDQLPEALGLRRYFSVFTGVSSVVEGSRMIQEAHEDKHFWGKVDGSLKIIRGIFEASSGFIQGTTTALKIWAEEKINLDALKVANVVGDFFACVQLLMVAGSSFHTARLSGRFKTQLSPTNQDCLIIRIFKRVILRSQETIKPLSHREIKQAQISFLKNLSHEDKMNLKKIIGHELFENIEHQLDELEKNPEKAISLEDLDLLLNDAKKLLSKSEITNAIIGILSLAGVAITIAADFVSAGISSQVLNILKPLISLSFFYFDVTQLQNGINEKESNSKFSKGLKIFLTVLCISIAIATFVGSGVATGGALPIIMLIIGILCPLISLYISNNKKQVREMSLRIAHFINRLNPFVQPKAKPYKALNIHGYELDSKIHIELCAISKTIIKKVA